MTPTSPHAQGLLNDPPTPSFPPPSPSSSPTSPPQRGRIGTAFHHLRRFLAFVGPGWMVSVGYMDPGNWATDMEAGARYQYSLLFVLLIANLMAILLQSLTVRLGVITGLDLAQASRVHFPRRLNLFLYFLCEFAIIACDLAEVIGAAVAMQLLFGLPLWAGCLLTLVDVIIILGLLSLAGRRMSRLGAAPGEESLLPTRILEGFVMFLVGGVAICFIVLLGRVQAPTGPVLKGFLPTIEPLTSANGLWISLGIIGATVMPHNLYLHSHTVKARAFTHEYPVCESIKVPPSPSPSPDPSGESSEEEGEGDGFRSSPSSRAFPSSSQRWYSSWISSTEGEPQLRRRQGGESIQWTIWLSLLDMIVALALAVFVNAAILIVSGAAFYGLDDAEAAGSADLFDAHSLLGKYLGQGAATIFAIALLLSGLSATVTATLAGQVVMEGFLGLGLKPWIRRFLSRGIAVIPATLIAAISGRQGLGDLLLWSQVILSLQLPFAVIPLVYLTSSSRIMKAGGQGDSIGKTDRLLRQEDIGPDSDLDYSGSEDGTRDDQGSPVPKSSSSTHPSSRPRQSWANPSWLTVLGWMVAAIIVCLNMVLLVQMAIGTE